jgi:Lon protease-like protein
MQTEVIPLFPLGSVLVPHLVLPLHIFEPRYRTLVANLNDRAEEDRYFGVVAIREGSEVGADALPSLYPVGTTAVLTHTAALPDGRFDISTRGDRRFRIVDLDDSLPYLQARVEYLDEPADGATPELVDTVRTRFTEYRAILDPSSEGDSSALPSDPEVLSYLVTAVIVIALHTRQSLLEAFTTAMRLDMLARLLRRESAILQTIPSLPTWDLPRERNLN